MDLSYQSSINEEIDKDIIEEGCYLLMPHNIPQIWSELVQTINFMLEEYQKQNSIFEITCMFLQFIYSNIQRNYSFAQNNKQNSKRINILILLMALQDIEESQLIIFLKETLPYLLQMAFEIKQQFPSSIKILKQDNQMSVSLSKFQVFILMIHMFFCTFLHPKNNYQLPYERTFSQLYYFSKNNHKHNQIKIQKIKCFVNYFNRMAFELQNCLQQQISFHRVTIINDHENFLSFWKNSNYSIMDIIYNDKDKIEESNAILFSQVDFANKVIGGGVLTHGCVQEEIRFCISPELIASILFTEELHDHEALLIRGCQQYNSYSGYGDSFKYVSNYIEKNINILQNTNEFDIEIIAIDALNFNLPYISSEEQFSEKFILRELNKIYVGFKNANPKKGIATGKWGCGVFQGNSQLKFLLQVMGASQCSKQLCFYTYDDNSLKQADQIIKILQNCQVNVGQLYKEIVEYGNQQLENSQKIDLFSYIIKKYQQVEII